MNPRPASRAQDHAADRDAADLRWPPSAADLDAIACVDVLSAGGGDLRAWLRQNGRIASSGRPAAVAVLLPSGHDAVPIPKCRHTALWPLAAASAVLAVAGPMFLRTSRVAETALTVPSPLSGVAARGTNVTLPIPIDRHTKPLTGETTSGAAEEDRATSVESALLRQVDVESAPQLVVAVTRSASVPPLESPAPGAPAERDRPDAPAPIELPPAIVPASLESTAVPAASLDDSAPRLASAIPVREEARTSLALRSEPASNAAPADTTATAAVSAAVEVASVREALSRYGSAYSRLDAAAARAVWPSVDARALGRAFAELRSQRITFDDCDIAVDGTLARAACRGATTYVPRAGDQSPRTEARAWRFELEKGHDANWRIASANISVPRASTRAR